MKIEYKFVTGETVTAHVYGKFEKVMLELNKNLKNNNRKETRRHESLSLLDKDKRNADITKDVFENVCTNLDKDKLYAAIAKLEPQEKELIYKIYLKENPMTRAEYARVFGLTENAVRKRLAQIKAKLKKSL